MCSLSVFGFHTERETKLVDQSVSKCARTGVHFSKVLKLENHLLRICQERFEMQCLDRATGSCAAPVQRVHFVLSTS